MRWQLSLAAACAMIGVGLASGESNAAAFGGPLIVHEWGTFTNFAGADGKQRPFPIYSGTENDLPDFVMTWDNGRGSGAQRPIDKSGPNPKAEVVEVVGRQRMETPVIYFYSGCPWEVDVQATLLSGQMTEFYPPLNGFGGGSDAGKADRSTVRWQGVKLLSELSHPDGDKLLPRDGDTEDSHYFAARETDAGVIQTRALGAMQHERFLFYRGVADFESRIMVKALGGDRFEILNTTGQMIPAAIAMSVEDGKLRWSASHAIGLRVVVNLDSQNRGADSLAREMERTLVASGLFEREAAAMVKTWRSAWFAEPGTRILYIMPRVEVDRVVPLKITPEPKETLRVFVGRMDVLTPEVETKMSEILAKMDGADDARISDLWADMPRLGRFRTAALQRIRESAANPKAVAQASRALGQ